MPQLLMNLRHVPDDEADDIRELFEQHDVRYYETPPSRWGISMGGFWVHDDDEADRARALLDEYQASRQQREQQAYLARQQRGEAGFWFRFRQRPVAMVAACVAVLAILALSLAPFLSIGN
ncbi:DUF6164 family protein [Marinobacter sp. C2H3]|uniref:DUF6164 family protein n=1 Tax=Marinobacter sp. C2H3 TaxID=3119003 RepID=UPI00300EE119